MKFIPLTLLCLILQSCVMISYKSERVSEADVSEEIVLMTLF